MSHQKKKKKRQKINHQMASDKIEMVGEREREREDPKLHQATRQNLFVE